MIVSVLTGWISLLLRVQDLGTSETYIIDEVSVGGKAAEMITKSSGIDLKRMLTVLLDISKSVNARRKSLPKVFARSKDVDNSAYKDTDVADTLLQKLVAFWVRPFLAVHPCLPT